MSLLTKSPDGDSERLQRLANRIEALATRDQRLFDYTQEIAGIRVEAAQELYTVCANFVTSVNRLLAKEAINLDPQDRPSPAFRDPAANLFQINVRGRILEVQFASTPELVSTEDFRIPYTLLGTVRAFNQDLLDKDLIEEQLLFYTVEKNRRMWRFFDPRTHRSGPFDQVYLISLMEQLL